MKNENSTEICPVCGRAELIHDIRAVTYIHDGEITTISDVEGDFCVSCGESILGAEESARVMSLIGSGQDGGHCP